MMSSCFLTIRWSSQCTLVFEFKKVILRISFALIFKDEYQILYEKYMSTFVKLFTWKSDASH